MPPTLQEQYYLVNPINTNSLQHNTQVLSNIRAISSLLLGVSAGVLGLQSLQGFAFYFASQIFVSALFYFLLVGSDAEKFYAGSISTSVGGKSKRTGAWRDIMLGGGMFGEALSGFVLGWAGVGGVIR